MTVSSVSVGTYSTKITIQGEKGNANIMAAVNAAIIAGLHWAVFDNTLTNFVVYRSINIDGSSHKYVSVAYDTTRQHIIMNAWESWNATTHVGLNPAFNVFGSYWTAWAYSSCDLVIFAGPRWLGMHGYNRGKPQLFPQMVCEITRDHPQDTPAEGIPCWAWVNPNTINGSFPLTNVLKTYYHSMPRTIGGLTGLIAAERSFISTVFGTVRSVANGGQLAVQPMNTGLSSITAGATDAWDATAAYVYTLRVGHDATSYQGKLCGLKATKLTSIGFGNSVSLSVDTNFFASTTGTPAPHWVLPQYPNVVTSGAPAPLYSSTAAGCKLADIVYEGDYYYGVGVNQVVKVVADDGWGAGALDTTTSASQSALVYDGAYAYFCDRANNKVGRINCTTDAVDRTVALTGGGTTPQALAFDGTNLWALHATQVANVIYLTKITASTMLVAGTVAIPANTTTIGLQVYADPQSGAILVALRDSTTVVGVRIYKIDPAGLTVLGMSGVVGVSNSDFAAFQWTGTPNQALVSIHLTTASCSHFICTYGGAVPTMSLIGTDTGTTTITTGQNWVATAYGGVVYLGLTHVYAHSLCYTGYSLAQGIGITFTSGGVCARHLGWAVLTTGPTLSARADCVGGSNYPVYASGSAMLLPR